MGIAKAFENLYNLFILLLFISILLTWFPGIKWYNEPFKSLKAFSDFFFLPFRRIIPPIGLIDISPIVAFFVYGIFAKLILNVLYGFGL